MDAILLNMSQVCEELGRTSRAQVERFIAAGKLPVVTLGRRVFVRRAVDAFLAAQTLTSGAW